jgi:hypothetical protein
MMGRVSSWGRVPGSTVGLGEGAGAGAAERVERVERVGKALAEPLPLTAGMGLTAEAVEALEPQAATVITAVVTAVKQNAAALNRPAERRRNLTG